MDKLLHSVQSLPNEQVLQAALGILPTLVTTDRSVSVLRASLLSLLALSDAECITTCCDILDQMSEKQDSPPKEIVSQEIVETDTASASTAATESTPGPKFIEVPSTPGCASKSPKQDRLPRGEMKAAIFEKLDVDDEGWLNSVKLLCFASCMGYSATADEWTQEYEATCRHLKCDPNQGLNFVHFSKLVDTLFNRISYCSDDELAGILDRADCRALRQVCRHATEKDAVAKASGRSAQFLADSTTPGPRKIADELLCVEPKGPRTVARLACASNAAVPQTRDELKTAIFILLDTDGDGCVDKDEFQIVATNQGFSGTAEMWEQHFLRLCVRFNADVVAGLDLQSFCELVDDDKQEAWRACTDDDLEKLFSSLQELHAKRRSYIEACTPKRRQATSTEKKLLLRDGLKVDVFKQLDIDGDERLNRAEMRRFACHNGFLGNREEWVVQYNILCKEFNIASDVGIDFQLFSTLVDDESQSGCHATDAELCALLDALMMKPKVKQRLGDPPYTRQRLKVAAFDLLDVDCDKHLGKEEMRKFASHNGFVGNAKQWLGQYNLLCRQFHASASVGIDFKLFCRLVDDESDAGCYCTDDELLVLVQTLLE
mmetsp:Transcript_48386/g.75414  ORF Transcript_48386/g.75414 Transcript_48386/m.75414 type:complete len:603 (-) Transcript_48386:107-1915(-)